jgi:hypothetical protein
MKDCTLHELETVVARLAHVERSDQGHYPFHNWHLLRRFLYNHAGFERDESVDPTGLSLLTADPTITLPYNISGGFDMEERDISALCRDPAQGAYVRDIHILIGVARARQDEDIPAKIPHLLSDHLRPVYATIPPHRHQSEGERTRLNLRILRITPVGDRLTMNRSSSELCEVEDCVFLRRIQEAREDADDELWRWAHGETELYWTMGRGDYEDDESDEGDEDHDGNESEDDGEDDEGGEGDEDGEYDEGYKDDEDKEDKPYR